MGGVGKGGWGGENEQRCLPPSGESQTDTETERV